jgi:hypothetical protein
VGGSAALSPPAGAYAAEAQPNPQEAPPDANALSNLVEKTGESAAHDNPLHLVFEVLPRAHGQRWLAAVVNRGTEPALVQFDMRRLTLELEEPEPATPRPRWRKKPAPRECELPDAFGGNWEGEVETLELAPGEGLVQTFDPRLYCISSRGESLLAAGLTVTPKLGYEPKPPKLVWRQGKRTEQPVMQRAPFIAEPSAERDYTEIEPVDDPRIKQLVGRSFEIDRAIAGSPDLASEPEPALPLSLHLIRGSDAASELQATVQVELRAEKPNVSVYFRRELLSFEVHGPDYIQYCEPQPDDRAPERQAFSSVAPGKPLGATSLLTELCPAYTFARPGLYLVSARFTPNRSGAEFGLAAFTGELASRRQALVRIRKGELPPLPQPPPIRVRVGQ